MCLRCGWRPLFLQCPPSINNPRGLSCNGQPMGSPLLISLRLRFHHLLRFWRRNAVRLLQGGQLEGEEQRWLRWRLVGAFSLFWQQLSFLLCRQQRPRQLLRHQLQSWRRFRLLRLTSPPRRIRFDAECPVRKQGQSALPGQGRRLPVCRIVSGVHPLRLEVWESHSHK